MGFRGKRTLMSAQRKVVGALWVEKDRLTLSEDPESVPRGCEPGPAVRPPACQPLLLLLHGGASSRLTFLGFSVLIRKWHQTHTRQSLPLKD